MSTTPVQPATGFGSAAEKAALEASSASQSKKSLLIFGGAGALVGFLVGGRVGALVGAAVGAGAPYAIAAVAMKGMT
jgi:uncharacterized membrane protein YebE (DUF533 family)